MQFPQAYKGVKKIFTAQVIALISFFSAIAGIGCLLVSVIKPIELMAADGADYTDLSVVLEYVKNISFVPFLIGVCFVIIFFALHLTALILQLIGQVQGTKDEKAFKTSLLCNIVAILASIVTLIFNTNTSVFGIAQIIVNIMSLATTFYVIQAIINLADKLERDDICEKGSSLVKIIMIAYVFLILSQIAAYISISTTLIIAGVLLLVSVILNIIQFFVYLSLLSKAKKMLADT